MEATTPPGKTHHWLTFTPGATLNKRKRTSNNNNNTSNDDNDDESPTDNGSLSTGGPGQTKLTLRFELVIEAPPPRQFELQIVSGMFVFLIKNFILIFF